MNTEYAEANGDTVKAFLGAVAAGWKDAIADPTAAAAALVKRNPAADAALEERRLELAINANVLTDYVKANGMGGIDSARFSAAIKQLSETYDYKAAPDADLYFHRRLFARRRIPGEIARPLRAARATGLHPTLHGLINENIT